MSLRIRSPADFHTHLRQNELMHLVTPHVKQGGFDLAYVMVRIFVENCQRAFSICIK